MLYIDGREKVLTTKYGPDGIKYREKFENERRVEKELHVGTPLPELVDVTVIQADGHEKEAIMEVLKDMRVLKLDGEFALEVYKKMKELENSKVLS